MQNYYKSWMSRSKRCDLAMTHYEGQSFPCALSWCVCVTVSGGVHTGKGSRGESSSSERFGRCQENGTWIEKGTGDCQGREGANLDIVLKRNKYSRLQAAKAADENEKLAKKLQEIKVFIGT